jgi:hypothetical protein
VGIFGRCFQEKWTTVGKETRACRLFHPNKIPWSLLGIIAAQSPCVWRRQWGFFFFWQWFWTSLVVFDNGLAEAIVLWNWTFSRMKTKDLWSGNDNTCILFPFWRRCYWRNYSAARMLSSLMVQVLLLRVFNHCDGVFVFLFLYSFCCLDVLDIELDRLNVISIFAV